MKERVPITVSIVEDDLFYRERLGRVIRADPGLLLLGSYTRAETALAALAREPPGVVVLSDALGGLKGGDWIRRVVKSAPSSVVLVLTGVPGDHAVFDVLGAGAQGFLEGERLEEIPDEIRAVHAGRHPLSKRAWRITLECLRQFRRRGDKAAMLTPREHEVALLMFQGRSNKEIAARLGIALWTVNAHVRNLFEKTQSHNRREVVFKLWGPGRPDRWSEK